MKIVARKRFWTIIAVSAMLVAMFAVGLTDATADGQKKDKAGDIGMDMMGPGGMLPGSPPANHLSQAREPKGRMGMPGMGMEGGMMGPGMGMEGGMGMGMMGGMGMGAPGMPQGMRSSGRVKRPQKNLAELPLNEVLAIALSARPADKDIPEIESLLARAMSISPEVVSARAALQQAQANLERIQLDVARSVIEIRARWKVARRNVERLEAKVNKERENVELARAYISARAELAQIERELPVLIGSLGAVGQATLPAGRTYIGIGKHSPAGLVGTFTVNSDATTTTKAPEPQQKMPKEFEKPVSLEFQETEIKDVTQFLQDLTKVQFILDSESGISGTPVTVSLKDIPLKDVLQAIEDTTYPVRFVVRPYGVLVTDEDNAVTRFGQKPQANSPSMDPFAAPSRR
ncbi:MAG: hypothetical protein JXM70_19360 [Pirellulales bacterium]|nr:hypothetical protein [Pirellulales bacterium]